MNIKDKKLYLFDMDGTLYLDKEVFPGTLELLDYLRSNHIEFMFVTNNSSISIKDRVRRINKMGIKCSSKDFFSSSMATSLYIKDKYPSSLVYVCGTRSLRKELKEYGLKITTKVTDKASIVLTGFDTELNYKKMKNTVKMLDKKNNIYLATNPDLVCPSHEGNLIDNGTMAIAYEIATGRKPIFIGKPEPTMLDIACSIKHIDKKDAVVIGDRLYTDILSAINAHIDSICVLSGEASKEDIDKSEYKPTMVYKSVLEIYNDLIK